MTDKINAPDDDALLAMAASACAEALAFGVGEDAFLKLARSVRAVCGTAEGERRKALVRIGHAAIATGYEDGELADWVSDRLLELGAIKRSSVREVGNGPSSEGSDFPAGAIENGHALLDRIEFHYEFECDGGPLGMCVEWPQLRECFDRLAEFAKSVRHQAAAVADQERLVRELDVLLNGEAGAAPQASLCDLVAQVQMMKRQPLLSLFPGLLPAIMELPSVTGTEFDGEESDGTPKQWRNRHYVSRTKLMRLLSSAGLDGRKPAGEPAAGEVAALNGIRANLYHGEGARAQCGGCKRYTMDAAALSDRQPVCECGQRHYWSGSFKPPGPDAKWHGAAPGVRTAASPASPEPAATQPVLVRDIAEILGSTVPDVCRLMEKLGFGVKSTNAAVTGPEALAVASAARDGGLSDGLSPRGFLLHWPSVGGGRRLIWDDSRMAGDSIGCPVEPVYSFGVSKREGS